MRSGKRIVKAKNRRARQLLWIVLAVIAVVLSVSFYLSNYTFKTVTYAIKSPLLPHAFSGFRIVQISDLHSRFFDADGTSLVEAVEEAKPDIVVLTGDTFDWADEDIKPELAFLKRIAAIFPTYYIPGNHELDREIRGGAEEKKRIEDGLHDAGVYDISNEQVEVERLGERIVLAGLCEDYSFYQEEAAETTLPVALYLGPKKPGYTVLLAHNPLYWKDYKAWGADLVLSGHVHGGGWRLPFIGGLFSPEVGLFPKYQKGVYRDALRDMVVSTGLGNSGTPFRLFNRPELVVVVLEQAGAEPARNR